MKYLTRLIFFLLLGVYTLNAQNIELALSDEIRISDRKYLTGLLHADDSGYYLGFTEPIGIFSDAQSTYLEKYDRNLKLVYSKEYKTTERNVFSLGMAYVQGQFVWLQYKRDRKKRELQFYFVPINMDGKAQKPQKFVKMQYETNRRQPEINWNVSRDTSKIVFVAEYDFNDRKEKYQAFCAVLDSQLNVLWKNKFKLRETQFQIGTTSYILGKDNNIYYITKEYEDNASAGLFGNFSSRLAYDMNILKVSEEGTKKFKLNLGDSFIKGIRIEANDFDEELTCAAMIGDSKRGPIRGLGYLKLNTSSGEFSSAKKYYFSEEELNSFGRKNTSKDFRSGEKGLDSEFLFRDIIYKEDGSFTVLAEEYRAEVRSTDGANGAVGNNVRTTFYNNHIISSNFNSDGSVESVKLIPKRYRTSKSGYPARHAIYEAKTDFMFFSSLNTGDNIYYLYNDDKKNFRKKEFKPDRYKVVTNLRECIAVISHIDANGDLQRKELFTKKEADALLVPKHSVEISRDEFFVVLRRPRFLASDAFKFGILKVE